MLTIVFVVNILSCNFTALCFRVSSFIITLAIIVLLIIIKFPKEGPDEPKL